MIELRTLGTLELSSAEGMAVGSVLAQPRRAALLCYLALASPRGFHRRDTLFALFWREYDAEQARHALRQSVYFIRRALGPRTIVSRGDGELALASEQVRCDVWEFDSALDQGRPADALALYRGELLAGFHISAAPDFERWLDDERSRLRRRACEAGWALAEAREGEADFAGAEEAARRAAALAPTDEAALRRLLLLLERLGNRAAAVRAYEAFAWKLEGEYELQPSAESQALVARIRAEPEQRQTDTPHPSALVPVIRDWDSRPPMQIGVSSNGPGPAAADPVRESEFRSRVLAAQPTPIAKPHRATRRAALLGGALVLLLLLGIAELYWPAWSRNRTSIAPEPPASEVAPGIAVLPFAVHGDSLANWREGLVDLVSTDLSGLTGLRAVDSRTVLARWRERVPDEKTPQLATALDVAERAGASYAVVGSAIANGPSLLLTSGVHEVAGGRLLGTARSEGPADSILSLVDRLVLEILRLVLRGEEHELPRIDLARVSTSSLPALKAYLEGEVLFRRSQFQSAARAYARAVEADSTFALARYRLALSREWFWSSSDMPIPDPLHAEVGPSADRLPPHEAVLFRVFLLRGQDIRAARQLLEGEVRRHPDDAETWHELGELYHHSGAQVLVPPGAADRAFANALKLDSTFTLPYIHRIDHAISAGDGTGAVRLLGTFSRLAPESPYVAWYRLLTKFAFGDPTARSRAEDTLNTEDLFRLGVELQGQRCCWGLAEQALRRVRERGELRPEATKQLFWVSLAQGKAREALGWVNDPSMPDEAKGPMLQLLDQLGVPIPAARLDSALSLATGDSVDAARLFYVGSYAASRGRWQLLQGSLARLHSRGQRLRATGDVSEAGFSEAVRQALIGYARWRRGQRDDALRLLERSQPRIVGDWRRQRVNVRLRWWLSQLLVEMGRPRQALPYLESLTGSSLPIDCERGRIYEQLGDVERAREAYALFLMTRRQADPMFQPMIQDARAALQRLAVATTE